MSSKSLLVVFLFSNLCLAGILVQGFNNGLQERKPYIVYMGGLPESTVSVSLLANSHHNLLLEAIGDEGIARESKLYSYGQSFNGFSARLLPHEAEILSQKENVVSVFPSGIRRLRTSRSWESIGMSLNVKRNEGVESDVIVGVFDTGIYVPSPSFNDSGYGPPPKKWKGKCAKGQQFPGCNNKVIGARFFDLTNASYYEEKDSPIDFFGHGTHTSSTAAGRAVTGASYQGYIKGTVRGGVPSARIAAYKVCWISFFGALCPDADILAAFDAAIHDGVDIISLSIGGHVKGHFEDPISIGAFHAMKKGILVVCAGGNDGPKMGTVENVSPWTLTVGASSDRTFQTKVKLGDGRTFIGTSIDTFTMKKMHPLLDGPGAANTSVREGQYNLSACSPWALSDKKVKGKIMFCRGFTSQDIDIKDLGGAGVIMTNDNDLDLAMPTQIPGTVVSVEDGDQIGKYINSTKGAKAWIQKTRETYNDVTKVTMASFSARGPQTLSRYILKPDISAPGLAILAAVTQANLDADSDDTNLPYQVESGTSMATPHVSGAAAYVKSFHPDWSPAAIKSALMTTATPFKIHITGAELATGSGQLNPRQALEPGLVYDINSTSYISYLCKEGYSSKNISLLAGKVVNCSNILKHPSNNGIDGLNYPSMHIQVNTSKISAVFHRTVTYVGGEGNSVFKAKIYDKYASDKSSILSATVTPNTLAFTAPNQTKSFKVTLKGKFAGKKSFSYHSASLVWTDGRHIVRSPILVYW